MSLQSKINLQPDEEIVEVVRRYSLTYFWKYILGLLCLTFSAFFMFWLLAQGWWGRVLLASGTLLGAVIIFRTRFFSRKNMLIITSRRVVDICREGWFDEIVSSVDYTDVKDAFIRRCGVLANLFNYGALAIETKSQQAVLEIDKIHRPQKQLSLVLALKETAKQNKRLADRPMVCQSFIKIIPELREDELRRVADLISGRLAFLEDEYKIEDGY